VLVLWLVSPTLQAFFLWQLVAALAGTLTMRWAAWRALGGRPRRRAWDFAQLRAIWRFSAGMSAIGVMAIVFTQLDKVLLSRILPLSEFGQYTLATTVCSGLYVFVNPIYNAVFPRFSALVARDDTAGLASSYRSSTRLLTAIVFPLAGLLALFPYDLLVAWTGNVEVARAAAPVVSLMAIGCGLHGVMFVPFALQIAHGQMRLALLISLGLLAGFMPLVIALALTQGARGGALAWLLLHLSYVSVGTWLTHRKLLQGLALKWLASEVLIPLLVCAALLGAASVLAAAVSAEPVPRLLIGLLGAAAACAVCVATSPALRIAAGARFGARRVPVRRESV
jgi:O-antigen/teichoic acid export membrane protein